MERNTLELTEDTQPLWFPASHCSLSLGYQQCDEIHQQFEKQRKLPFPSSSIISQVQEQQMFVHDASLLASYREAIENNLSIIRGGIVLDLNAGIGVLSCICAKAGALKVYAIEPNPNLAHMCLQIVKKNGLEHQVCLNKSIDYSNRRN